MKNFDVASNVAASLQHYTQTKLLESVKQVSDNNPILLSFDQACLIPCDNLLDTIAYRLYIEILWHIVSLTNFELVVFGIDTYGPNERVEEDQQRRPYTSC